jgi:hypothetical protein
MRKVGIALLAIGFIGLLFGLSMDTTVASDDPTRRIHNIGLMSEKQNVLLVSGVLAVIGALFMVRRSASIDTSHAPEPGLKKCFFCAESIKVEAKVCRYCGKSTDESAIAQNPATAPAISSLERLGFSVSSLGSDKWRVARRSTQDLHYPNSSAELEELARNLSPPK